MTRRRKPVIGLVGGIGAGKSAVATALESLGAAVIDSDRIVHELYVRPEVMAHLREWWGDRVFSPSGEVNRRAVADLVFDQPGELRRLEGLLYPLVDAQREQVSREYQDDPRVCAIVIDAPKLYEAGIDRHCDAVIFVEADRKRRLERVARSRGWTEAELFRREHCQEPLDKKRTSADYIVENNSSIDLLRVSVGKVLQSVLAAFNNRT